MKNLFKSLMLVAVAAMAFTACSQDNNELNNLTKKTVFNFQANIGEDTRSGFMEKEEGATSYKSEWHEGDKVKIFIDGHEPIVTDIDTEGNFSFELEGEVSETFFMSVCAPADSWEDLNTCNIPYYQEPLKNTVDPRAHLLSAKYVAVTNGAADITMIHNDAAYVKMTLDIVEDFEVESVEVMFEGEWIGENITRRYEVSSKNVENNTFWFACDPMDAVSKFSVVARDAEWHSMSKTVDVAALGREMYLKLGHVATFSVEGLTMPLETVYAETTVNENAVTFEWEEVENAVSYTVYLKENLGWNQELYMTEYGPESSYTTTELTHTVSDLKYNTYYAYAVVANPAADSKVYTASEKMFRDVITGIDPNNFDYEFTFDKFVKFEGSTLVLSNASGHTWNIIVNPGLTSIVEGTYKALQPDWFNNGIIPYTSADALEYDGFNSYIYTDAYLYLSNDIVVTVDGGVYTIVMKGLAWIGGANKTYKATFTGSFDGSEEPAAPAFRSAAWVNTSLNDKLVQFSSEELGTLQLNFYNANEDKSAAWLDARTYGFANNFEIYPGGEYSWYENETAGIDAEICNGTVIVAVVDGQYFIEFKNLVDWDGNVYIEYATFTGMISGLTLPDTREKLATPSATATAEGNVINISWDAVTGADEYYVFCYVGGLDAVTTTDTSVTIEAAYSTKYDFLIRAIANDSNPDYKNSEDYYFSVTTEKDPNVFADYIYDTLSWNSQYGRFELTGNGNGMTQFYVNSSDSPNNNSIKVGTYSYAGNTVSNPGVGTFSLRYLLGSGAGSSHYVSDASMSVTVEDGEYCIVITIISAANKNIEGKTFGYKGLPNGFVLPEGGGDDNTGDGGESTEPTIKESYNVTWQYFADYSSTSTYGHAWNVSSDDGGFSAQITTDSRNGYSTSTSFTPGTYFYHALYADGNYGSGMYFTMRSIEIEGVGYSNDAVNGVMVVKHDNGVYGITIDLYNYINGYTTDKITTLVGTFGSADSGSGDGSETTDPENPAEGETTVPEGYIEMNQCIYYGDLYGAGLADEFVLLSADGKNKLFFNINNATTDSNYIPTGEYTIASVGSPEYTFNMSTISDTTYINGQAYGNGVADNSSSTMSVVSEGKGGIHEIKLTINNNQGTNKFYFKGTIN